MSGNDCGQEADRALVGFPVRHDRGVVGLSEVNLSVAVSQSELENVSMSPQVEKRGVGK